MKQITIGIFAHPDDEGFGPSGTLLKQVADGVDVHLFCLTDGSAGQNVDNHDDLGSVRHDEWQRATELIGASSTHWLSYKDGELNNNLYHKIADEISEGIETIVERYDDNVTINFMTFDTTGLSGHIDHIVASLVTSYLYVTYSQGTLQNATIGKLLYFAIPYHEDRAHDTSYLYSPPGRSSAEIDISSDVSDVFEQKLEIMRAHRSQRGDMNWIIETNGEALKTELFRVLDLST